MQNLPMNGPPGQMNMMAVGGTHSHDLLVPGNKIGLIIGKGGETIKSMQERCQCKIAFTQDISVPSDQEKNLRIIGDPAKVETAKKMVADLLNNDRMNNMGGAAGGGQQNQFGNRHVIDTINVPRSLVGMVIGKGGDMIRKIQDEHAVRLQFDQDNKINPERICTVTGPPDRVRDAVNAVNQLMANDRNKPAGYNNNYGQGNMPQPQQTNGPAGDSRNESTFTVPVEKCGLVIGKNGVTINDIKMTSGAHVEIQRNQPENLPHKHFLIRGDQQQTQKAIELISAKIGAQPEQINNNAYSGVSNYGSPGPSQQVGTSYSQGWGDATYSYAAAPYSQQTVNVAADPTSAAVASTTDWTSYYAAQAAAQQQPYWGQVATTQAVVAPAQTPPITAQVTAEPHAAHANFTQQWYDYYMSAGYYDAAQQLLVAAQQHAASEAAATPR